MLDAMTVCGLAERTKECYVEAIACGAHHYKHSPDLLSLAEIEAYWSETASCPAAASTTPLVPAAFYWRKCWGAKPTTCAGPWRTFPIKAVVAREVVFSARAGSKGGKRRVRVAGAEFVRRFQQHVSPTGLQCIRHCGVLANARKGGKLARARQALVRA